jgi:hypothetical protein
MKSTLFESDEAFWKAFEQFNFLYGGMFFEWKPTTARKEHDDIFNVRIKPSETYFRKELGGYSYDSAEKLSMSSMEKLLYVVIGLNEDLGTFLQSKLDQQMKDLVAKMR